MHGWIDQDLRRWKPVTGNIVSMRTTAVDRLACPICRAENVDEPLYRSHGEPFWLCAQRHTFDCALLP